MYQKRPYIEVVPKHPVVSGLSESVGIIYELAMKMGSVVLETFPGVDLTEILKELKKYDIETIDSETFYIPKDQYLTIVETALTSDRIFGKNTFYNFDDFFIEGYEEKYRKQNSKQKARIIFGAGASLIDKESPIVYYDLTRWEIQRRQRNKSYGNWNQDNLQEDPLTKYKIGYFLDWKMANKLKNSIHNRISYYVDANIQEKFTMINIEDYDEALNVTSKQPFRLTPFFDSAPWGGQWMKEKFDLDRTVSNFGWSFDGVPDENSLVYKFNDIEFEIPAANLISLKPKEILGERVAAIFGNNFPIRFNYLDTVGGGNLSLQVHPLADYIQKEFGMPFTQDESYYIMDSMDDSSVYLGVREDTDKETMFKELEHSNNTGEKFDALKHVNHFSVKKHDHVLIPAGTVHCSGPNTVVLEISATVNWFTFKLWDWGRLGLDGKPRPVHLNHGIHNVMMDRTESFCKEELINNFEILDEKEGYVREKTGLHELEFIETHRHWFDDEATIHNHESVSVINVVEGEGVTLIMDEMQIKLNYAETCIIPACINSIKVVSDNPGKKSGIIQAFIK